MKCDSSGAVQLEAMPEVQAQLGTSDGDDGNLEEEIDAILDANHGCTWRALPEEEMEALRHDAYANSMRWIVRRREQLALAGSSKSVPTAGLSGMRSSCATAHGDDMDGGWFVFVCHCNDLASDLVCFRDAVLVREEKNLIPSGRSTMNVHVANDGNGALTDAAATADDVTLSAGVERAIADLCKHLLDVGMYMCGIVLIRRSLYAYIVHAFIRKTKLFCAACVQQKKTQTCMTQSCVLSVFGIPLSSSRCESLSYTGRSPFRDLLVLMWKAMRTCSLTMDAIQFSFAIQE